MTDVVDVPGTTGAVRDVSAVGTLARWRRKRASTGLSEAVLPAQIFCIVLFVFPSDNIIKVIGASGFVGGLLAIALFFGWLASVLCGVHNPLPLRSPARTALVPFWLVSIASYATAPWQDLSTTQSLAEQRWFLELIGITGVVLVLSEGLKSFRDVVAVLRALVNGVAIAAAIGVVQFWARFDIVPYIRSVMPGFEINGEAFEGQARGALVRAAGTASNPLELGTLCGALLPAAIHLALWDRNRPLWRRVLPVLLLAGGVTASVSRSAVLALAVSGAVYTIFLPARRRLWMFVAGPIGLAGVFVSTPGFLSTFLDFATAGTSDPSISNRTNNYPFIAAQFAQHPWLGTGGGTYLPINAFRIFDNEYLTIALELGGLGIAALLILLLLPPITALIARNSVRSAAGRDLGAILSAAAIAVAVGSATFDTLSFGMITFAAAVIIGLVGAYIRIARESRSSRPAREFRGH